MANVLHSVQSRLKHRKVLGVGESADGKFPRSKICQLLGNDHMNHVVIEKEEYPYGLHVFQWLTCLMFSAIGMINITYPQQFYRPVTSSMADPRLLARQISDDIRTMRDITTGHPGSDNAVARLQKSLQDLDQSLDMLEVPARLYGAACLSLAVLFFIVALINRDNRRAIRIALIVEAIYLSVDVIVTAVTTIHVGYSYANPTSLLWVTAIKVAGVLLCSLYYIKTNPLRDFGPKRQD